MVAGRRLTATSHARSKSERSGGREERREERRGGEEERRRRGRGEERRGEERGKGREERKREGWEGRSGEEEAGEGVDMEGKGRDSRIKMKHDRCPYGAFVTCKYVACVYLAVCDCPRGSGRDGRCSEERRCPLCPYCNHRHAEGWN
jgi:hypothetical protein